MCVVICTPIDKRGGLRESKRVSHEYGGTNEEIIISICPLEMFKQGQMHPVGGNGALDAIPVISQDQTDLVYTVERGICVHCSVFLSFFTSGWSAPL